MVAIFCADNDSIKATRLFCSVWTNKQMFRYIQICFPYLLSSSPAVCAVFTLFTKWNKRRHRNNLSEHIRLTTDESLAVMKNTCLHNSSMDMELIEME